MGIVVRPLTAAIGAEVEGVDLGAPLDADTRATLHQAVLDHLVLFFQDQDITPSQQLAFAEHFAPIMLPVIDTQSTEVPGVTVLDQTDPRGQYTERWHTDSTFLEEPPWGAVLRAVQLPPVGGDTCWASMYAAYEQLSAPMRRFLDGLTAEHSTSILDAVLDKLPNVVRRERKPPVRHPVVRVHPETGRKLLFVNANFTDRIVDLDEAESRMLLGFLFNHLGKPHFQVRYHWTPNAVALWDNRPTQHCAMPDYRERRLMYRCMMQGDRPVGPVATAKDS
jgi:taurine dioxygenase